MRRLWVLSLALLLTFAAAGDETRGEGVPWHRFRDKRPRLFFNEATFAAVRKRALTIGRDWFDTLMDRSDAEFAGEVPVGDHGDLASSAAFAYLVTGEDKHLEHSRLFLEKTIAHYRQCDRNNHVVSWYTSSRINAFAAFDWICDSLDAETRKRMAKDILEHVKAVQPSDDKPAVPGRNTSGITSGFYGTPSLLWYAGIATVGTGADEAASRELVDEGCDLYMQLLAHRSTAAGDDGGAASIALNYAYGAYPWAEFNFFYTMRSAFDTDIAPQWPYVPEGVVYLLWNWLPGARWFGSGDAYHETNELRISSLWPYLQHLRNFYAVSKREHAALAHWLQSQLPPQTNIYAWPFHPFLLTDLEKSPEPLLPAGLLPPARHFERMGQIFMRSGSGPKDTYALFTTGSTMRNHKHFDENNFVIFRNGFLALDSGTRPEPGIHLNQYYCRTVAHNCVTIRMPGEQLPPYWYDVAPGEEDLPVPNDGGMNKRGGSKLLAFETGLNYTYIASDATPCYSPEKCSLATRQFVFLPPDHFVVYDRVVSTDADYPKRWLLHTAREPLIEGEVFSAEQELGRIFCRTLLPADASITKTGGPKKQFWNDGRNWPLPKEWRTRDDIELL
ncbi:MAG: heparinase II/III family protein [Planctomycetes bacterium]|nr:heparinase II/III family protein [Planctomycetota bacterium]